MRGHLLKCWPRVLALCMSTPALPRVGRGQPEPKSVLRPHRWNGAGSALFTGVPTRNSWRVQINPLKMFLSFCCTMAGPGTGSSKRKDSWEETRDRRNLGKRGGYRWWRMKELDLGFFKLAPLSGFPKHRPLAPSSIAYCEKRHMENDTLLRARLFSLGIWWFFRNSLK